MYAESESIFYYLTVYNETYAQPEMPQGVAEGILKGMYRVSSRDGGRQITHRPQLFGSGPILQEVLQAQQILAEQYGVGSDVWSVTSYATLARAASAATRWNKLHPHDEPKSSYLEEQLSSLEGPFVAASDNVRLVADQIREWVPGTYVTLGTDGFGRSETREALRRHFEIDAECTVYATLVALAQHAQFDQRRLPDVIRELSIDPEKVNPLVA
jgi:pyruvate dehydrogenase E1 component